VLALVVVPRAIAPLHGGDDVAPHVARPAAPLDEIVLVAERIDPLLDEALPLVRAEEPDAVLGMHRKTQRHDVCGQSGRRRRRLTIGRVR
jgi:hypothetical protein